MGLWAYSSWGLSLAVSIVGASLFGWAASRFFIEARRTGELELLLTTPLGAERIVSGQWNWLKRLLFWPIVILIVPRLAETAWYRMVTGPPASMPERWAFMFSQLVVCVNIIIGIGALFWAGIWFGLKARSQAGAILRVVLLARGTPWLISLLGQILLAVSFQYIGPATAPYWIIWSVPQIATLLFFLWLIRWARRRLQTELRHECPAPLSLSQAISHAFSAVALLVRKARRWPHGS